MSIKILHGDCRDVLRTLPDKSVHSVVTSPPYWGLRDYGVDQQIGLEQSPEAYIAELVVVFREVKRVLRDDGVLFLNLGDSYCSASGKDNNVPQTKNPNFSFPPSAPHRNLRPGNPDKNGGNSNRDGLTVFGLKPKDLIGIPWMAAFALRADGWWLRRDIIWAKPNPMPESVTDRPTSAHEYVFLLTKSARYFWDAAAVAEPSEYPGDNRALRTDTRKSIDVMCADNGSRARTGQPTGATRNLRSVWTIATQPNGDWVESVRQVRVAWDAPVGGKKRITSPDCPLHGDHPGPVASAPCGERADDPATCSARTGNDPASEQQPDCAPIEKTHGPGIVPSSSDCQDQPSSLSAIRHNTQSRKTARAPETNLACMPCAETPIRTGDTSVPRGRSGSAGRTPANKNGQVETGDNPTSQIETDSARISAEQGSSVACGPLVCTCEHYITKTEKTSHFATFPPALAERCILAGSRPSDTILDPFGGAGTVGLVADRLRRDAILIELNPEYIEIAKRRLTKDAGMFADVTDA